MASPFRAFRKHQKQMVVVLTLLAMFAFVVLPIVLKSMGTRPVRDPTVVTTTRYGDIGQQQLKIMLGHRRVLHGFFVEIARAMGQATGNPYVVQQFAREIENLLGPVTEQSVAETWLLARRAEDLGVVVSDDAVNAFLRSVTTAQGITADQVRQILAKVKLSQNDLFALLKEELLALELRRLFETSLGGTTPAERWDYYQRLNRKVTIEAMPVPVSRFADQVPHPDEATLQKFFQRYKEKPFVPGSPEPGFLVPQKIAVEYFKVDHDKLDQIVEVSDDEVTAYYEANKDQLYRREKLPEAEPEEATEPGTSSEEPAAEKPPKEPSPGQSTEKPVEKPVEEPRDSAASDETSMAKETSAFRLIALEQEGTSQEAGAEGSSSEAGKPSSEAATDEQPGPALTPAGDDVSAETPASGSLPAEEPSATAVEYVPLDDVSGEIRTRLAEEKVKNVLDKLRNEMTQYQNEWIVYNSLPEDQKRNEAPPEKLDMAELAKQNRLSAHKTALISVHEARSLDIGKSNLEGNVPFTTSAYQTLPEYRPAMSQDDEGNYYLFWKVEETEQRVPEWGNSGVQAEVLLVWKMIQAREPAKAEAEQLAERARAAGQSLAETFGDDPAEEIVQSEPFSWMTYGSLPALWARVPPRLSEIKARVKDPKTGEETERNALEMPGDEFMRAVFRLNKGEVGVAVNRPQTVVYVVRVTDVNPLPEVLWRLFITEDFNRYALVARTDQLGTVTAWREGIKAAAGFQWQREPDRDRGR